MLEFDYDSFWCWWQIYQWLWRQVAILVLLLITNNNIIENVFKNKILTHWPTRSKLYISTVIILLVVQKCFDHFVFFGRNLNISIAICQLLCCFITCDGYMHFYAMCDIATYFVVVLLYLFVDAAAKWFPSSHSSVCNLRYYSPRSYKHIPRSNRKMIKFTFC